MIQNPPQQSHESVATPAFESVACVDCQRLFSPADVLRYGEWTVCSGCKDHFVQKLEQGGVIGGITAWRHKRLVRVLKDNPTLPSCCTKCGEPATVAREKSMRFLSMRSLLGVPGLFFGIIPGLILMTLLGTSVKLKFGHCEKHAQRQKLWRWIAGGSLGAGILMIFGVTLLPNPRAWAGLLIAGILLWGIISLAIASPGVSIVRGNKEHVDFRVSSRKLKKGLPEWTNFLS